MPFAAETHTGDLVSTPFFGRRSIHLDRTGFTPPHLFTKTHARGRMWQKVAALIPLIAVACFVQGWPALRALSVSVCGAVVAEAVGAWVFRRLPAYHDGESIFIGLFCALILPLTLSIWIFFGAAVIAVFLGREIFGGFGQAVVFPPAAGLLILFLGLPQMIQAFDFKQARSLAEAMAMNADGRANLAQLLFYPSSASIEDVSFAALAAGVILLLACGLVRWELPALSIVGLSAAHFLSGQRSSLFLPSGGFWLVLFWGLAQTSAMPLTPAGRRIYALLAGFLAALCGFDDEPLRLMAGLAAASLLAPWFDALVTFRTAPKIGAV